MLVLLSMADWIHLLAQGFESESSAHLLAPESKIKSVQYFYKFTDNKYLKDLPTADLIGTTIIIYIQWFFYHNLKQQLGANVTLR